MTLHPDGDTIATAQLARHPIIYVWKTSTRELFATLAGGHWAGVGQLAFVGAGKWLLSVGMEESRVLHSWDWKNKDNSNAEEGWAGTVSGGDYAHYSDTCCE